MMKLLLEYMWPYIAVDKQVHKHTAHTHEVIYPKQVSTIHTCTNKIIAFYYSFEQTSKKKEKRKLPFCLK